MDRRRFIRNLAFGIRRHGARLEHCELLSTRLGLQPRRAPSVSFGVLRCLPVAPQLVAFTQAMDDLGWLEGKNIMYRVVYANGDMARLDALANDLVGQEVEIILAPSPPSTRAAQRATKTIPIVMGSVANPVGNGFVASLSKPGGNITGIANLQDEVLGKLIGVLHEVAPSARRVAIVLNETNPVHPVFWAAAQSACAALGLVALRVVANAPAQFGANVNGNA